MIVFGSQCVTSKRESDFTKAERDWEIQNSRQKIEVDQLLTTMLFVGFSTPMTEVCVPCKILAHDRADAFEGGCSESLHDSIQTV